MTLELTDREALLLHDALETFAFECDHSAAMLALIHEPANPVIAMANLGDKKHRALQIAARLETRNSA